jgi:hypothetical protein
MFRRFTLAAAVVAVVGATGGTASAADSFKAGATPATAGTVDAPATTQTTVDLQLATDANGKPRDAATSIAFALPADFASNLSKFDTCDAGAIIAAATGGPHAPPDCPETSKVGGGAITVAVPSLNLYGIKTNVVYLYKVNDGMLGAWFYFTKTRVTGASLGPISAGTAPYGPTITWDFSLAAQGSPLVGGQPIYVVRWANTFKKWKPADLNAAKRAACNKRANKKKGKARKQALKKCAKTYKPKPGPSTSSTGEDLKGVTPFGATGCTGGSWPFEATVKFINGTPDAKLTDSVTCS